MDGANPGSLMGFINDYVPGKVRIGRIDLMKNFSFFEVPEESANKVLSSMKDIMVEDRKLVVELAGESSNDSKKGGKGRPDRRPGNPSHNNKRRR